MLPDGKFCDRLESLLKSRGISAEELARLSGLNATSVSRYRSGAREPTASGLLALAGALGVTMEWLLTGQHTLSRALADSAAEGMLAAAMGSGQDRRPVLNEAPMQAGESYQEVSALREENQRLRDIIGGIRALLASEPVAAVSRGPVDYRRAANKKP